MRRMYCECLILWVPSSSSFESTNIRAVTQLSLCITADDLVVVGLSEPLLLLLGSTLLPKCDLVMLEQVRYFSDRTYFEHAVMESIRSRLANELSSSTELLQIPVMLLLQDPQPLLSCQSSFEPICATHEVVL
jgi:hypothetical protein